MLPTRQESPDPGSTQSHRSSGRGAGGGERRSDEALMAAYVERGCEASFGELHERYEARIRGFLLKRLGDVASAEDLTQSAFARILKAADRFDAERSTFSRWSHTIVENVLKNHYRSRARSRLQNMTDLNGSAFCTSPQELARPDIEMADPAPGAERAAFAAEFREALNQALEDLEPLYREPFVMYQVEQYSFAEIAARLGIPVGTAKSRTHRARVRLREVLGDYAPDHGRQEPKVPLI